MGGQVLTEEEARKGYVNEFQGDWNDLRDKTADPKQGDPFAGGHGKKAELEGADKGQQKHVGQAGFGARLLGGAADAAHAHADEWGQIATPVQPSDASIDAGVEAQKANISRNTGSDWYDGDPAWLKKEKQYSREWAGENIETLERHRFEQFKWCGGYNDWSALANAGHGAMAELVESAGLMGFNTANGKDSAGFVEGLEMSLDMAIKLVDSNVLDHGKASWSTRGDNNRATSKAQPQLAGEQMTPKLDGVKHAYADLQVAHHGIYQGLLNDRRAILAAEKGQYTSEVEEINAVIEFWAGMGEMVGGNMPKIKGAVTGKTGASIDKRFENNGDHHAHKELKQAQNDAYKSEQNPSDYRSHIDSHAHGGNYEDHHDTWGKGGEEKLKEMEKEGTYTPSEVEPAEMPELSVGGLIRTGLTLYNAEKLEQLQKKIAGVDGLLQANGKTLALVQAKQAQAAFKAALAKMEDELKKLGEQSMRDREQDMVNFGHDLDKYAVEHKDELQKLHAGDLIPGGSGEIYGTAMACVAKVEKYRQLSQLALQTFPFNEFNQSVTHIARERAGIEKPPESASRDYDQAYRAPPSLPQMSAEETEVYQQIAGTYLNLLKLDSRWGVRLAGVHERFLTLTRKVSGNNSKGAVGKKF